VRFFDGGPVQTAGTVSEDDEIADSLRVVHLPGHTPGQIGLWRRADRLALVGDYFYTLDPFTHESGPPRVPHAPSITTVTKPAPRFASSRRWTWLQRGPVMLSR
jgi:glyoxylase-like metal-dependent hydrolase (beta-lactamase superfamily II)